jgi:hypothetical protein
MAKVINGTDTPSMKVADGSTHTISETTTRAYDSVVEVSARICADSLVNFGMQNLIVFGTQFALQAGRIVREERPLSSDGSYLAYKKRVRYRVIPSPF